MNKYFLSLDTTKSRYKLPITDKNRVPLHTGDIVAEGILGEDIWEGAGKIIRRPLGIIWAKNTLTKKNFDEDKLYGVFEIATGSVLINKNIPEYHPLYPSYSKGQQVFPLHLSNDYNQYLSWNDCELIGSVLDLEKVFDDYYKLQ